MPNRLAKETSPYLQQHKDNPVDWYPWGEEALEKARQENKPILLSVGYSACHWCHVMAHESFENEEIAKIMNTQYVNIKIDREERPDIDQIYQNVAQILTRSGGWPLTVFLLPDLRPFYGGTYFPPDDRYGRPGFARVLESIADTYKTSPEKIQESAKNLTNGIARLETVPRVESGMLPTQQDFLSITDDILSSIDYAEGGLGGAPKFPNSMIFSYLWHSANLFSIPKAREAVLFTLEKMAAGGIYDQLGGGFHRYSTDDQWLVPHFEKMLYDNGLLLELYSEVAVQLEKENPQHESLPKLKRTIEGTAEYLFREMLSPEGLFYSAQDADSEGEEGKFFVWEYQELKKLLNDEEFKALEGAYSISEHGNFEEKIILAEKPRASRAPALAQAEKKLFSVREKRIKPGLDDKHLTAWNALAVSGLIWSAQALVKTNPELAEKCAVIARRTFKAIQKTFFTANGELLSHGKGTQAKQAAFLDDYAFLAKAAIDLARFEQNAEVQTEHFNSAFKLVESAMDEFSDPVSPGYFFTPLSGEKLIHRPKSLFDQAIPNGSALLLTVMQYLSEANPERASQIFGGEVERQISMLFPLAREQGLGMGELLKCSLLSFAGTIVVKGKTFSKQEATSFGVLFSLEPVKETQICHKQTCQIVIAEKLIQEIAKRRSFSVLA